MTKKIPEIRFDGFDEEWEEVKIKDIADVKAGGDINKSKLRDTGRYPVIGNGITKDSSIIGYYEDEYKVKAPAVTLTGRGDIGVPIARNVSFTPVVRLLSLKFQDQYNVYFMANSLSNVNFLKETTGVPQLTSISVKNYKIKITSPPEQEKIGALFEKVDSLIEGQAGLVDSYKGLKKSLLQKMFPNEGEKIPQLRFNGFEDEWEESKLGDLSKIKTGNKDMKDSEENGKYPFFIRSQNILRISTYSYDGEAILIPGEGNIGQIFHYINGKFDYHQRVYKISNFDGINGLYVFFYLQRFFKKHAQKNSVRATVDSLRLPTIKNFKVYFPSLPEQKKIGDLFKKLDGLIEDEEKYLEDLKVLKKSLLQKMFV